VGLLHLLSHEGKKTEAAWQPFCLGSVNGFNWISFISLRLTTKPDTEENKPPYPGNNILSSASTTPISVDQSHEKGYGDR